ncbi:hypothetical protein [Actinoallomurus sp. NPDC050550]|uniref:hypothetical protein n=1 Tax=Actinoallomurus sp. NPDC050550 TaxID=3154937 RepID=UPI0033E27E92
MRVSAQLEKARFVSGGVECAAWHYPGTNGACVIMGAGGAVTKEPRHAAAGILGQVRDVEVIFVLRRGGAAVFGSRGRGRMCAMGQP